MVRLKGLLARHGRRVCARFNSCMVRLKALYLPIAKVQISKFQFLHGTIKGNMIWCTIEGNRRFQFLHGTIKGVVQKCYNINSHSCFNSCMVRLKGLPYATLKRSSRCFNSCMVRLKVQQLDWQIQKNQVSIPAWYD